MRRLWLGAWFAVAVLGSGCSSDDQKILAPPPLLALSGLQGTLVPPTPAIQAKLLEYIQCQTTKQQAPEYSVLRNKYFFAGAAPTGPLLSETYPTDEEQVALAKWEVGRKLCVSALGEYIEFFAPFDHVQHVLFADYQNQLRTFHQTLLQGKITFATAWRQTRDASEVFWAALAERNKDVRTFMIRHWLAGQATP